MADEAVVVHFRGDPAVLAPRYAEGIRRFQSEYPDARPRQIFLGRGEAELVVVLVWPKDIGHEVLGRFMQANNADLELPFPHQATHFDVEAESWEAIAAIPVTAG